MIAAPAGWEWVLAGFVLFRLFDVLKPWPISWFDRRIHGGLGIMLDDLIAGLFALACMQLLAHWRVGSRAITGIVYLLLLGCRPQFANATFGLAAGLPRLIPALSPFLFSFPSPDMLPLKNHFT